MSLHPGFYPNNHQRVFNGVGKPEKLVGMRIPFNQMMAKVTLPLSIEHSC